MATKIGEADALRREAAFAASLTRLALADQGVETQLQSAIDELALSLPHATAAIYTRPHDGGDLTIAAQAGDRVPTDWPLSEPCEYVDGLLVVAMCGQRPGISGLIHVAGELDSVDVAFVCELAEVLTVAVERSERLHELATNERRLIEAQRISLVGSYDFEIATNTNLWSDQLYRIYGREPQSFNASYERFLDMILPEDREHVMAVHQRSLETLEPFNMEERVVWPDGQVRTLASWGEVVVDADGKPARMVGICWDITERKHIEEQLVHEALHDRLTGLPNRALLMDRLTQRLGSRSQRDRYLGVLFIDVDRFKVVNDSLGHDAGDEVLIELANRFKAAMRPGDTVARFGGDEFVVLCADLAHAGEAFAVAERLQRETSTLIRTAGGELVVEISIGIAISHSPHDKPSELLRDADAAMYRAKHTGRGKWVVFADEMREKAIVRLDVEQQLRRALNDDQLQLHYQPIVNLATGRVVAVEALVRWPHPSRGMLAPDEFVSIAEESGLIVALDDWVMQTAFRQLAAWQDDYPQLTMSVNLSGIDFLQNGLVARVSRALRTSGAIAERVALEITETILMRDVAETTAVLDELRGLGVRLHIDDFGTGYSSLSYLRRFPVAALKVDQSFVAGLGTDVEDRGIVKAIVALADVLGLETIAEGVEAHDQLASLRELGCTNVQGYLLSPPCEADKVTTILSSPDFLLPHPRTDVSAGQVRSLR